MTRLFRCSSACVVLFVAGCGVSQSEHDKLKTENDALKAENVALKKESDELKNGAERLAAQAEKAYQAKDYSAAKQAIKLLATRHPESPKNAQFTEYLKIIEVTEQQEQARRVIAEQQEKVRRDAEEKERKRLANLNNTGMWEIGNYVDEFGNKTAQRYVTNREPIVGTFSNSATQDSALKVVFLINSKTEVAIQLYEYARDNPVKAYREEVYKVAVQDSKGEKYYYTARNHSDRLRLDIDSFDSFYKAFLKGGIVRFRITEADRASSSYAFDITPEGYENAIRILAEPIRAGSK